MAGPAVSVLTIRLPSETGTKPHFVALPTTAGTGSEVGRSSVISEDDTHLKRIVFSPALLAKAVARDAQALPAHAALRAATLAGAQALGIDAVAGSITPGKAADLAAVTMRAAELAPCYDPVSHLVYAAGREHVTHVWVHGEARVIEGRLQPPAFSGLEKRWQLWQNALKSHADS